MSSRSPADTQTPPLPPHNDCESDSDSSLDVPPLPPSTPMTRITNLSLASRLITLTIILLGSLLPNHDNKVDVKFDGGRILDGFTQWDSAWFLNKASGALDGDVRSHVFFPLPSQLTALLTKVMTLNSPNPPSWAYCLSAIFLSNLFFVLSARQLFRLSSRILKDQRQAEFAASLYCFNPASVFFSVCYSEVSVF